MRWMVLVLLVCLAAPAHAIYHGDGGADDTGGDPAGDAGEDQGDAQEPVPDDDAPAGPPGWESAPETVGAERDEGDGEIGSRGMILLIGSVLVVAVLAAALFFASRRP